MENKYGKEITLMSIINLVIILIIVGIVTFILITYSSINGVILKIREKNFKSELQIIQNNYLDIKNNKTINTKDLLEGTSSLKNKITIEDKKIVFIGKDKKEKNWAMDKGIIVKYAYNNPYIPKGFYYVGGKWNTGFVISDNKEDENIGIDYSKINTLKGNQFVWVPIDGKNINLRKQLFDKYKGISTLYSDIVAKNLDEIKKYEISVDKYGGFYMGRYEASLSGEKVEIKQGVIPITNVTYNAASRYADDMYRNHDEIISTLPYGSMWDATLNNFIKNSNMPMSAVYSDSSEYGNYLNTDITSNRKPDEISSYKKLESESISVAASSFYSGILNIYDMSGNVSEWTRETYALEKRVYRGGSYIINSYDQPISYRSGEEKDYKSKDLGFRVALYMK